MARYTGAVCRLCRREGIKMYLKGDRCYTPKCAIDRRSYAPGDKGQSRKKVTEYGLQLQEKQRARRIYGILERQFRRYFALPSGRRESPVKICCACWSAGWTMWSTGSDLQDPGLRRGNW